MEKLNKAYRTAAVRVGFSLLVFVVFIITGVMSALTHHPEILYWLPVLGIAAIMILPRAVIPRGIKPDTSQEREMWTKLTRVRVWLTYVRALYLLAALFVFVGLPELF